MKQDYQNLSEFFGAETVDFYMNFCYIINDKSFAKGGTGL